MTPWREVTAMTITIRPARIDRPATMRTVLDIVRALRREYGRPDPTTWAQNSADTVKELYR